MVKAASVGMTRLSKMARRGQASLWAKGNSKLAGGLRWQTDAVMSALGATALAHISKPQALDGSAMDAVDRTLSAAFPPK